jgi:8-oxo-dGTP pyrophosphatase MutT (NUDIX family)
MLILHRARERYWHVVAGVVEHGERYAEAAARELREESGLDVGDRLIDLDRPKTYPLTKELRERFGFPLDQLQVTTYNFAAEAPSGWEPVLNDEHDAYRWCSFDEAVSSLYWPSARDIARELAIRPR